MLARLTLHSKWNDEEGLGVKLSEETLEALQYRPERASMGWRPIDESYTFAGVTVSVVAQRG